VTPHPSPQPFLDDHEDIVQHVFPSTVLAIFMPTLMVLCAVAMSTIYIVASILKG
jgi:hypothetical protein